MPQHKSNFAFLIEHTRIISIKVLFFIMVLVQIISFANSANAKPIYLNIKHFGAKGDGVTNDTAAIQAALNKLEQGTVTGNFVIFLPAGTYKICQTLQPPNSASYWTLKGEGKLASVFRWGGPEGVPMMKLTNARGVVLEDFGMYGRSFPGAGVPSDAIQVHRGPGQVGSGAPMNVFYKRIFIGNHFGEEIDNGISYTAEGYPDQNSCEGRSCDGNNEQGYFVDVEITNVNQYGLSFEHSNSLLHKIYGGMISAGEAAINNVGTSGSEGGSFQVFGTTLSTDPGGYIFRFGQTQHAISIFGAVVESSGGLLTTPNQITWGGNSIQIIGGSFKLGLPTTSNPTVFYDATNGASLTMSDAYFTQEVWWKFPSSGSTVAIENVNTVTTRLEYNNEVFIDKSWNGAGHGAFALTNLGDGKLIITDGSGSFDGIGNKQRFQDGDTTPSVQGWDYYEANYLQPATITDFEDGYTGKEFSLYSGNTNNIKIKHGGKIWLKNQMDLKLDPNILIKFRKVSAAFGSRWVQVD